MYNNTVQYYKIEEPPLLFATQMGGQTSVINLDLPVGTCSTLQKESVSKPCFTQSYLLERGIHHIALYLLAHT